MPPARLPASPALPETLPSVALCLCGPKALAVMRAVLASADRNLVDLTFVLARDTRASHDDHDAMHALAEEAGLKVAARESLSARSAFGWTVAIGWKWVVPASSTLLVIHDSLLPRYRGFNPLVSALKNGDTTLGATLLFGSEGFDSGDIVDQRAIEVRYPITLQQATDALVPPYCELVLSALAKIARREPIHGRPQPHARATYSVWLDEADYLIDWSASAHDIRRHIDAVGSPYRGASSWWGEQKVRIHRAHEVQDIRVENRSPGKTIFRPAGVPWVICGSGLLALDAVTDDVTGQPLLPLSVLRRRFVGRPERVLGAACR